jgi:hypothetical protein
MKTKKMLLILLGGLIPLGFLLYPAAYLMLTGCEPPHYTPPPLTPIPDYNKDLFSFPKFNLPAAKAAGSVDLTVVNIIPEYKDTLNQEYAGGAKVSAGGAMTKDMLKVFKSFAGSAGEDVEAQLVAKGMTTKGPFALTEVTYPDKKGADLTVMIHVIFDIQYTNQKYLREEQYTTGKWGKVYSGNMSVGLKVYYYMLEPLSDEKMWIKKLDLGVQDFNYELAREQEQYVAGSHWTGGDGCGGGQYQVTDYAWRDTDTLIYDSRAKIFSDILKQAYPQVMKTAWTYFDTHEMLNLKMKSQEIRERKRY